MSRRPTARQMSGRKQARTVQAVSGHRRLRRRAAVASVVMVLMAGGLVGRLTMLQVVEPDRYVAFGESQRIRTVALPAGRGAIVDRDGVDLALTVPRQSVVVDPGLVVNPVAASRALAPVLQVDELVLEERLARSDSEFQYLARHVPDEVAAAALQLGIGGVYTIEEAGRFRPGERLASSVIGTTDIDNRGISGVELAYDDLLTGSPGSQVVELGLEGDTIPGGRQQIEAARPGQTLVLSLDRTLQFEAERMLGAQVAELRAAGGILLAMDPTTGEMLASASVVRDPDSGVITVGSENRAVTWAFEPGSIVKPITLSAVLESGLGDPTTFIDVPDSIERWEEEFHDSRPHPEESWSLSTILAESSNVGTILWAEELGADALHEVFTRFRVGQDTPLDLPQEALGFLPDVEDWSGTSLPTIAIGQGVAATPIQMLLAYAAIANDGVVPDPTYVLGTRDEDGLFDAFERPAGERVIEATTAASLLDMLRGVVEEGTGQEAQVPGYVVAGKTGTAWKPLETGGYGEDTGGIRYIASFAGVLPVDDPELVVLVVIDEPAYGRHTGNLAAAPVFADFAGVAVDWMRIPSIADEIQLARDERVQAPAATLPPPTTTVGAESSGGSPDEDGG